MAEEIELKLSLPATAHQRLLRHPLLKATPPQRRIIENRYYDTPDLHLWRAGIGLRIRRQNQDWLQTVKCSGRSGGGLSTRPEWETPYSGTFDFSAVDDPEIRHRLEKPKTIKRLLPVFETRFRRSIWRLEPARGQVVLLMFDRGEIAAGGRREAISEVELELAEGDVGSLFAIARQLAERLPLMPMVESKAERGYRLHADEPMAPVRATEVLLTRDMTPRAAFHAIAVACLDHLQRNHAGAISSDDPEYIHQMRVAARRLRAALRLFQPQLPEDFAEDWLPDLRALVADLGRARDLDVLAEEIVAPACTGLPSDPRLALLTSGIAVQRDAARAKARDNLLSALNCLLILRVAAALNTAAESAPTGESLGEFAAKRLKRLRVRVLEHAALTADRDPFSRHRLRIGIKRLRYALEFFAPMMPRQGTRRTLGHLTGLQDALGQLNDLATAGRLLEELAADNPPLREATALVGGWQGPRRAALEEAVSPEIDRLRHLRLPRITQ